MGPGAPPLDPGRGNDLTRRIVRLALRVPSEGLRRPSAFLPDEPLHPSVEERCAAKGRLKACRSDCSKKSFFPHGAGCGIASRAYLSHSGPVGCAKRFCAGPKCLHMSPGRQLVGNKISWYPTANPVFPDEMH